MSADAEKVKLFCLCCRAQKSVDGAGLESFKSKNGRDMVRGACMDCGKMVTSFKKAAKTQKVEEKSDAAAAAPAPADDAAKGQ